MTEEQKEKLRQYQSNREQIGCVHFHTQKKKWQVYSARPEQKHIGFYFTEEKAREALNHYNLTGERMKSDRKNRKKGTGGIYPTPNGRHQAQYMINGKRKYKNFDTVEQCEAFLKETLKY